MSKTTILTVSTTITPQLFNSSTSHALPITKKAFNPIQPVHICVVQLKLCTNSPILIDIRSTFRHCLTPQNVHVPTQIWCASHNLSKTADKSINRISSSKLKKRRLHTILCSCCPAAYIKYSTSNLPTPNVMSSLDENEQQYSTEAILFSHSSSL